MKRGATLVELVLTLVIIGTLATIALPRARGFTDSLVVQQAAVEIASAHRRARISAILQSRIIELTVSSGALSLRPRGASVDIWSAPGPAASGVVLAGPPQVIIFSPVGISMGVSNATFRLSRGAATRAVVVSRLGRLRFLP
ncbi:MAG: GspH/FimT family pseudopilin [Gemmatimonadales bacterium]